MLVLKECVVLSDQASFPPIICFQINFPAKTKIEQWQHRTITCVVASADEMLYRSESWGCNYFSSSSLAPDLLPIMFSSIRSVCLCHVFSDLATFELRFPGLCSVSNLYHLAGSSVLEDEASGRSPFHKVEALGGFALCFPMHDMVEREKGKLLAGSCLLNSHTASFYGHR
ncbi:unnamed protein product [Sphenostylis stenocarpa]|uniref:Uncharacterized protein n=1 Tax=Sphenostylis stenocarpa TaxID=92480 RepID=A0AA86SI72_9FABA|nr:unnamed protein product [Sphenostylis stenocarpa]